ncbi:MAG: D-glycero-beta-D-manno-heptose 1,7-bisphosphate 7-phosphatase [Burkholderiaceae bacterium]|nr:MAG: D-glycero-beta-D-manno-heptose 1,7-bisphosphate 7-phosphatase [Burkholderiaceae bacterium]
MNNRLVILDRDGVINFDSPNYIKSPEEWIPIPGSIEAIARIKAEGWKVVVATNQSAVGRGIIQLTDLFNIHAKLLNCVRRFGTDIDGIFFCPHRPSQECACRKPKPGMFQEITKRFGVVGKYCITVGDSLRDLKAAEAISARSFLVLTGNGGKTLKEHKSFDDPIPDKVEIENDLSSVAKKLF